MHSPAFGKISCAVCRSRSDLRGGVLLMMAPAAAKNSLVFGITTVVALLVFLMTLAPQVTFGHSGIFSTAAMYPGPSTPSGHPLWAIVGWAWMKVFPFGNIAWRLAVGSAVAAAIACGIVAVMVARVGGLISAKRDGSISAVSGIVAGLGLAFEQGFWSKAVVVDSWAFTGLLFTVILYCFSRWFFEPTRKRWLYGAVFIAARVYVRARRWRQRFMHCRCWSRWRI